MGFSVELAVDHAGHVVGMTEALGDDQPGVIVETESGNARLIGASMTRILAISSPASGAQDGRTVFPADQLATAISTAREAGQPTLSVSMDGATATPSGPSRRLLHTVSILHGATSGNPLVAFEIAADDLQFLAQQAARFAGSDGTVRLEYRRGCPLVMRAGCSALVAVLANEVKPTKPAAAAKARSLAHATVGA